MGTEFEGVSHVLVESLDRDGKRKFRIGDIDANGLRRGSEQSFQAPPGFRVEAILPPVENYYPEGLVVLVAVGNNPQEAQAPAKGQARQPSLERLDALAEAIARHRKLSIAVIAMLDPDS